MTRKEAIENIRKHFDYMQEWITPKEVLKVALEALEQPKIVRCKDCKYHGNIYPDYCVNLEQNTNDDFYCADGERK